MGHRVSCIAYRISLIADRVSFIASLCALLSESEARDCRRRTIDDGHRRRTTVNGPQPTDHVRRGDAVSGLSECSCRSRGRRRRSPLPLRSPAPLLPCSSAPPLPCSVVPQHQRQVDPLNVLICTNVIARPDGPRIAVHVGGQPGDSDASIHSR